MTIEFPHTVAVCDVRHVIVTAKVAADLLKIFIVDNRCICLRIGMTGASAAGAIASGATAGTAAVPASAALA